MQYRRFGEIKRFEGRGKKRNSTMSAKCWWQFAEGSVPDLFKVDKIEKGCFVCYTFTIDENLDRGRTLNDNSIRPSQSKRRATKFQISK